MSMEWKTIIAIIRTDKLEAVESCLKGINVRGISVTKGKGYGEYANFFTSDWYVTHARLEIYCEASRTDEIANTIIEAAHTGVAGDGMVTVLPVEKIYRIRTKTEGNDRNV
jgi:nitrogen regulatory protein P-II 1